MAEGKAPVEERVDGGIYADFDTFLKQGIKEYYDRGWTTRRGNFIALLIACSFALGAPVAQAVEPGVVVTGTANKIDEDKTAAELLGGVPADKRWVRVFVEWSTLEPSTKGAYENNLLTGLDGKVAVNPSGGLIAKGHPVGATGCAQLYELVKQLRGEAANQVRNAEIGLAHNLGGPGVVSTVTILGRR
jgi:hypothetical protein